MAAQEKHLYQGGSTAILNAERRNLYISPDTLSYDNAVLTPFLTSLASWGTKTTSDPQFKMFEYKRKRKSYFKISTGATVAADDGEDAITITSTGAVGMPATFTNYLVGLVGEIVAGNGAGDAPSTNPNDIKGQVVITTFTNATTVSVKNKTKASITIANNDWFVVTGTAFGEGASAANPYFDEIKVVWNQLGIHKKAFQVTRTLYNAYLRGESNEYLRLKAVAEADFDREMEFKLLFSQSNIGTNLRTGDTFGDGGLTDADGNVIRDTYGAFRAIWDTGVTTGSNRNKIGIVPTSYKYSDFVSDCEAIFDNKPERILPMFCSDKMLTYFNQIEGTPGMGIAGNSKWTVNFPSIGGSRPGKLGFNIREWESPHGTIQLVPTRSITDSVFNGAAIAIDPAQVFLAQMKDGAKEFQEDIKKDNAPEIIKSQFRGELGVGLQQADNHTILYLKEA